MKVPWTPFNLGVFLIVFGGLMFASLARISNYDPIQSFTLTIMIFGVWLALAAFILTPPVKYARLIEHWSSTGDPCWPP